MSVRHTKYIFNLPFINSFNTGSRRFITLAKVHTFLGINFYSKLNNIYVHLLESFAKKNYRYLSTSLEENLLKSVQDNRFRLRIESPPPKLTIPKPKRFQKILTVRQRVWTNGTTRIGLQCNVIFGEKFDKQDPLKLKQKQGNIQSKILRIGQFRYLRYYPNLGILRNIKNWYKQQTYQLFIKYGSKMHLQVQSFDEVSTKIANQNYQQVFTEMKMRTGNQKFDWVIVDINQIQDKIA